MTARWLEIITAVFAAPLSTPDVVPNVAGRDYVASPALVVALGQWWITGHPASPGGFRPPDLVLVPITVTIAADRVEQLVTAPAGCAG
ncbi:MAG: hypothetical protein ACRDSH_01415 [Pseudonocardiaceae bacterium]